MALGTSMASGLNSLALRVGIDVNSQSFQDFQSRVENAMNSVQSSVQSAMPRIASAAQSAMPAVGKALGSAVVGLGQATAGAITAVSAAGAAAATHMIKFGDDFNSAMNQLQASTGATEAEMVKLEEVAKNVYGNNFGESIEDVANSMATVNQQLKLTGSELETATQKGLALRDTFEFEIEESTRAVNALMKQFGITADEAYDIIATGAQNGANQNGDLLDILNEYSNHYAQLGLSADDFAQSLVKASEVGVFSMDKVGDAVKEFGIRAQDGSATSIAAFETLGLNATEMTKKFASGGDTARDAMLEVVSALQAMEDPVAKNAAGVGLFGTMYEDLGPKVLDILGSIEDSTLDTTAAMEEINKVKYNDLGSAIEGIKRSLEVGLLPVASEVAGGLTEIANKFSGVIKDGFQPEDVEEFANYIMEKVQGLATGIEQFAPALLNSISSILQTTITALAELLPTLLPIVAEAGMSLLQGLLEAIVANVEPLVSCVVDVLTNLVNFIIQNIPMLLTAAIAIVTELAKGLADSVQILIPSVITAISAICQGLINNLGPLLEAALVLIAALAQGLIAAIPQLVAELPKIITSICNFFATNFGDILQVGIELVFAIITGLMQAIPDLLSSVDDLLFSVLQVLLTGSIGAVDIGKNIVEGLWNGISKMAGWIKEKVTNFMSSLVEGAKKTLGINSPSKVFMEIGGYMSEGVGVGFDAEMPTVDKIIKQDLQQTVKVATDFDIPNNSILGSITTKVEDKNTIRARENQRKSLGAINLNFNGTTFTNKAGMKQAANELKQILQAEGLRTGSIVLA